MEQWVELPPVMLKTRLRVLVRVWIALPQMQLPASVLGTQLMMSQVPGSLPLHGTVRWNSGPLASSLPAFGE